MKSTVVWLLKVSKVGLKMATSGTRSERLQTEAQEIEKEKQSYAEGEISGLRVFDPQMP